MPTATSLKLRQQVQHLHQTSLIPLQIAQQLSMPIRTVRDFLAIGHSPRRVCARTAFDGRLRFHINNAMVNVSGLDCGNFECRG